MAEKKPVEFKVLRKNNWGIGSYWSPRRGLSSARSASTTSWGRCATRATTALLAAVRWRCGFIGMMFTCPDALQRRMKELEELKSYLDEIRETDKRFRNEEIRLSGFEW